MPASVPKWRNWQTRRTQNPVPFTGRVGSIPTFGTKPFSFGDCPLGGAPPAGRSPGARRWRYCVARRTGHGARRRCRHLGPDQCGLPGVERLGKCGGREDARAHRRPAEQIDRGTLRCALFESRDLPRHVAAVVVVGDDEAALADGLDDAAVDDIPLQGGVATEGDDHQDPGEQPDPSRLREPGAQALPKARPRRGLAGRRRLWKAPVQRPARRSRYVMTAASAPFVTAAVADEPDGLGDGAIGGWSVRICASELASRGCHLARPEGRRWMRS